MCDGDVIYIDGERKYIAFTVSSTSRCAAEAIVITEASYTLDDVQTGETVLRGKCEINDRTVKMLISPAPGYYRLTLTITIPPETLKHREYVCVKR